MKCVHRGRLRTLQSSKTNNGNGQTCSAATFIVSTSIFTDSAQYCSRGRRSIKHIENIELLADLIQQQEHMYSNKIPKRMVGDTSVTDRNVFFVVDSSGSILPDTYNRVLDILANLPNCSVVTWQLVCSHSAVTLNWSSAQPASRVTIIQHTAMR